MAITSFWECILYFTLLLWGPFVVADNESSIVYPYLENQHPIHIPNGADSGTTGCCVSHELYITKRELQARLSVDSRVYLRGEDGFVTLDARYTEYKRPNYIAAVEPITEQDVVETVNYCRSRGIPFSVRAGGHSLTTSLRRIKNGIVINLRRLNSAKYDSDAQQMTVGAGITTGEFTNATHAKGMEVTVGSCPCTGVMGISLGVGIGRLQGKYGYAQDNMVSARLLLANGSTITASRSQNEELFWALRGAGHNFGIVLEATFRVYPQLNGGRHLSVDFEFDLLHVESVFTAMNAISDPMPKEVAIFVIGRRRGANGKPTININLVYSGPEEDAEPYVGLFDAIPHVWKDSKVAAWDALPWATYNGLNNIVCTPEGWARYPIKNFYAANVKTYDIPTMRSVFDEWAAMNEKYDGRALFTLMFESFPQQRVREINDNATAYPWRDGSQHFLLIEGAYKTAVDEDQIDEWLSSQQDKLVETSGYGRLQQYVNYGHGSKDPPEALYGYEPWRLEKLRRLKREYDPEGLFNGYQPFVEPEEY